MLEALMDGLRASALLLAMLAAAGLGTCIVVGVCYLLYSWADWRGRWLDEHPEEAEKKPRKKFFRQ